MAPVINVPQAIEWQGKHTPSGPIQTVKYCLLLSQDPAEVDKVLEVCSRTVTFYLDLQSIDGRGALSNKQEAIKPMKRFFEAPIEQKNEFGLISSHLGYEPVGSRTGAFDAVTEDGYAIFKVSRDEI